MTRTQDTVSIWTCPMILNFEEYLSTDSGPNTTATAAAPVSAPTPTTAMDVTTITNALSLAYSPSHHLPAQTYS